MNLAFVLGGPLSGAHLGPMRDGYASIAAYADPVEAELACGRLQAAGIAAELSNDSAASSMYGAGNPITHQVLHVESERMQEALALLAAPELASSTSDPGDAPVTAPAYDGYFRSDWNSRERAAESAYRASIIGWLVPLVSWYALWKLIEVVFSDLPLNDKVRGRAIIAGAVTLLPALVWLVVLLVMMRR